MGSSDTCDMQIETKSGPLKDLKKREQSRENKKRKRSEVMKEITVVVVAIDKKEAIKRGINAPGTIALEVDMSSLKKEYRDLISEFVGDDGQLKTAQGSLLAVPTPNLEGLFETLDSVLAERAKRVLEAEQLRVRADAEIAKAIANFDAGITKAEVSCEAINRSGTIEYVRYQVGVNVVRGSAPTVGYCCFVASASPDTAASYKAAQERSERIRHEVFESLKPLGLKKLLEAEASTAAEQAKNDAARARLKAQIEKTNNQGARLRGRKKTMKEIQTGWAGYLADTKPKKLGELEVNSKKLPVWVIEVDDAKVDARSLIELTDEFRPGCWVFATVLFNQFLPTYDRWIHQDVSKVCCPLSLTAGQWIAAKQTETAAWRHFYLVDVTPNRLVAVQFSALPADRPYLNKTRNDLLSGGFQLPSVDQALKFKFLDGAQDRQAKLVALIQPAFTRYGIRCETKRLEGGLWEKTTSDLLSREHRGIARQNVQAKLKRVANFVEAVLDSLLAKDPNWTPKAQKLEAYFDRFNPRTAEWLQTELLTASAESDNAKRDEFLLKYRQGEEGQKSLESRQMEQTLKRARTVKTRAEAEMLAAPSSPTRKWTLKDDGIYIEGPWDAVLGKCLRERKAKWLRPGWRVPLKHARAIAELLRDYPTLEAQRQELLRPARECLAAVPIPTGYEVHFRDWNLGVIGCGNAALDALLTGAFGADSDPANGQKTWTVPAERALELADAFRQYPPAPEPAPVTEAEAAEALQGARMPVGYSCKICQNRILVQGPYLEGLVGQLRALNGTWHPVTRQWTLPLRAVTGLAEALRRFSPK